MIASTARTFLLFANATFLVSSAVVAIISMGIEIEFFGHDIFNTENWASPPMILALVCAVIFMISLFGWCGLILESRSFVSLFSIILVIFVLCEIGIGVYTFNKADTIGSLLQEEMKLSLAKYKNDSSIRASWDFLQDNFGCCGVTNITDWSQTGIPASCCPESSTTEVCSQAEARNVGCYSKFVQFLHSNFQTLAIITISVGTTQILCSVVSAFLSDHIHKLKHRRHSD